MGKIVKVDDCSGANFLDIAEAIDVLANTELEIQHYDVFVVTENGVPIVLFRPDAKSDGSLIHLGVQPEMRVILDSDQVAEMFLELEQMKVNAKLSGRSVALIQKALPIFLAKVEIDIRDYQITVAKLDDAEVVIFNDKDRSPTARGHNPGRPGFEVELESKDLAVRKAHFLR